MIITLALTIVSLGLAYRLRNAIGPLIIYYDTVNTTRISTLQVIRNAYRKSEDIYVESRARRVRMNLNALILTLIIIAAYLTAGSVV